MPADGLHAVFQFNGYTLDLGRRTLMRGHETIALSPKEFLTLTLLVEAEGKAVSRETLIAAIWPDTVVGDTSLARNVSGLRRHLGGDAIEVVPKFGYRFTPAIVRGRVEVGLSDRGAVGGDKKEPRTEGVTGAGRGRVVAIAAAVLLGVLLGVRLIGPRKADADPVTPVKSTLTWSDPQTGLEWMGRDNGATVTRAQAVEYCRGLRYAGYTDWRLPSIDELQTLYDPSVSEPGLWGFVRPVYWHVKGNLLITGGETATDIERESGQEQSYDFSFGRRNYDPPTFSADHRALCVRLPGKTLKLLAEPLEAGTGVKP